MYSRCIEFYNKCNAVAFKEKIGRGSPSCETSALNTLTKSFNICSMKSVHNFFFPKNKTSPWIFKAAFICECAFLISVIILTV